MYEEMFKDVKGCECEKDRRWNYVRVKVVAPVMLSHLLTEFETSVTLRYPCEQQPRQFRLLKTPRIPGLPCAVFKCIFFIIIIIYAWLLFCLVWFLFLILALWLFTAITLSSFAIPLPPHPEASPCASGTSRSMPRRKQHCPKRMKCE